MIGAIYGRLVGNVVQIIYNRMFNLSRYATPFGFYIGTYALVGAASFLGGVVRMTISLAVIILESTNEILFGLPVVLALMVAKWTGDYFNEVSLLCTLPGQRYLNALNLWHKWLMTRTHMPLQIYRNNTTSNI